MNNGFLIFIIVLEAVAIVWLLTRLKHHQRLERQSVAQAEPPQATPSNTTERAHKPTSGVAGAVAAALTAPPPGTDDDLLDMPGVETEVNIEEAKRVQLVMARCHYAQFYLEQLDDDYERGQFKHIVDGCKNTAAGISDPFFKASALQPLIMLLDEAGWNSERDKLLAEVNDDIIRQRIMEELAAEEVS
ncbi:MAG: hypothetical protein HKN42_15560 [Granulosicoccus sp.]|nr:hypothetical protein [Granulosicoccus sp.]